MRRQNSTGYNRWQIGRLRSIESGRDDWLRLVAERHGPARLRHVIGVAETAARLAERFGADVGKAWLAGLLHDYARELAPAEVLRLAEEYGLLGLVAEPSVEMLHAPLGSVLLRVETGVEDPEVLAAVARHTTGAAGMTTLDKVVYLADFIEPGRRFPGVDAVRALAERDLDGAVLAALRQTVSHVEAAGRLVDERTRAAIRDLTRHERGEGGQPGF